MKADLTPWVRDALYPEEREAVRAAGLRVSARSPRGPWTALGPGGAYQRPDIRAVVNLAAGRVILDGLAGERYWAAQKGEADA